LLYTPATVKKFQNKKSRRKKNEGDYGSSHVNGICNGIRDSSGSLRICGHIRSG
jgi:hypothetical protein